MLLACAQCQTHIQMVCLGQFLVSLGFISCLRHRGRHDPPVSRGRRRGRSPLIKSYKIYIKICCVLNFKPCWNSTFSATTGYILQIRCFLWATVLLWFDGDLLLHERLDFLRENIAGSVDRINGKTRHGARGVSHKSGCLGSHMIGRISALVWFPKNSTATWPSDFKTNGFHRKIL